MRRHLVTILILAGLASGCASSGGSGANAGGVAAYNRDPARSQGCYGGPVYPPC